MNLRQYITVLALGTGVALSAWCIIVLSINPVSAGSLAYAVFYITLMSGVAGVLTIAGTLARARKYKEDDIGLAVARSLRQSLLLTFLVGGCLFLLTQGMFSTLTAILLVVLMAFVEFLFLLSARGEKP